MIIHTMPQRSPEWYAIKRGKFSASDFGALMPSPRQKLEWTDTQLGIIYRVAAERMTDADDEESYQSRDMERGANIEEEARAAYEMQTGNSIETVGFIEQSDWVGCSPDGLIGEDGGYEGKAPRSKNHLRYRITPSELLDEYQWQVYGNLWVSGRAWWDLCSYDPRFISEEKQILILHVERNDDKIKALEDRINAAIEMAKAFMSS